MKLLEKILVYVNLENTSHQHVEVAKKLAEKFNSKIILLSVLPKEAKMDTVKNYIKLYADEQLSKITDHLSYAKEKIEKRIEYGNVFERIISVSEMENVNLVINFNTGNDPDSDIKVDVLSEKLVRKSIKPIMILKPGTQAVPQNILCPVDFSDSSKRALNNAIKIAKVFNSKLFIINVFEQLRQNFSKRMDINFEEENKKLETENKKQLDAFINKFNLIDVDYTVKNYNRENQRKDNQICFIQFDRFYIYWSNREKLCATSFVRKCYRKCSSLFASYYDRHESRKPS